MPNDLDYNRIGISVSAKSAPRSVNRNRCRRLLLESYRHTEDLLKKGYDIVLISRKDIAALGLEQVTTEVIRLYKKTGIII